MEQEQPFDFKGMPPDMIADVQVKLITHVNKNRAEIADNFATMVASLAGQVDLFRATDVLDQQMAALDEMATMASAMADAAHKFFELLMAPTVARTLNQR